MFPLYHTSGLSNILGAVPRVLHNSTIFCLSFITRTREIKVLKGLVNEASFGFSGLFHLINIVSTWPFAPIHQAIIDTDAYILQLTCFLLSLTFEGPGEGAFLTLSMAVQSSFIAIDKSSLSSLRPCIILMYFRYNET